VRVFQNRRLAAGDGSSLELEVVAERDERKFFRRAFCHPDRVPGTLGERRWTSGEATQSRSSGLAAVGTAREMARIT
jgi:hypothetical protein